MADQDVLPRLADALVDVGTRLSQIGEELRDLRVTAPQQADAPPAREADAATTAVPATPPPAAATHPGTAQQAAAGHPDQAPAGQPGAAQQAATSHAATPQQAPTGQPTAPHHTAPHHTATGYPSAPHQPPVGHPGAAHQPPPGYAPQQPDWTRPPITAATHFGQQPFQRAPQFGQVPPGVPQPGPQAHWDQQPPPVEPKPLLWERLSKDGAGSRLLAWAGGVVTLAGVVLLLVLAIQRGWLGPVPRVLLGAGLGLTLAGIGMLLHRNPTSRTGAYAVGATGIAVLFLDGVAATSLYGFLPVWGGLLTGLAVTAGGVALAGRWGSEMFAVFVVVCSAVSAPILTEGFDSQLLAFLLVLLVGATPVQLAKRWGGLALAAGLPPVIACVISIILIVDGRIDTDPRLTAILCGVTSGLLILLATVTTKRRPADDFAFATLLFAPAAGMLAATMLPRLGASVLPAAVAVVLVIVWMYGSTGALPARFTLSAGGLATLALLQATATAVDGDARAIALLGEALVVTVLAIQLRLKPALIPAGMFGVIGLVLALAYAATPELVVRPPRRPFQVGEAVSLGLTGLVLTAVAITLCWAIFRLDVIPDDDHAPHGWVPAGLIALYGSTAALLSVGLLINHDRTGFLLGHVFVTVSWTIGAFVLLLRGIDSVALRVAGLSLVAAALVKLVLFDLSSLDGMARVAAFLVAGLVLLAAGTRYAKLVAARARP